MNSKIEEAKIELENWLSDPNELGCKPFKIEYTNEFTDEDGIECMIFKYKKSLFSKWMLGIVSESGTFSEMKEYNRATEIADAKEIFNMLKAYWKEMGKNVQNKTEYREEDCTGWNAIKMECERVYPGQTDPKHYGTLIDWEFGGNDPVKGISIYETDKYWHFVTYGLTELYDKENDDKDVSGYGMEFTLKLKKDNYVDTEAEIKCICGILQQIARITFTSGEVFKTYEYLYTGQTQGIDSQMKSNITGFITVPDTSLNTIDTPNGRVEFVEFIGVTNDEITAVKNKEIDVRELHSKLGSDITDYNRKSVT